MCRIRTGNDITKKSDIQNMITGYMLRENGEFTVDDIIKRTKVSCVGCQINDNDINIDLIIENMAKNTALALLRNEYLVKTDNKYLHVNV